MKTETPHRLLPALLLGATLVLVLTLYWPGLKGPFLLDDFHNLELLGYHGGVTSLDSALRFTFGNVSGPTGRPVSMASFLLDDATWPAIPFGFKRTNLLLHLLVGLVIFLLVRRLLRDEFGLPTPRATTYAVAVCAVWLLHPLHVSTVLYVIQRMALLSALFSFLTYYSYLVARAFWRERKTGRALTMVTLGSAALSFGVLAKENAILTLLFIGLSEAFLLSPALGQRLRTLLRWGFAAGLVLLLPVLVLTYERWGSAYAGRDFTLLDRLLLQPAILGDYIGKVVFPTVSRLNLFVERFQAGVPAELPPFYVLGLFIFLGMLGLGLLALRRSWPLVTFGLAWFFTFHLLESTILPLELYFEHRNYLPSLGLVLLLVPVLEALRVAKFTRFMRYVGVGALTMYLAFTTFVTARTWAEPTGLFLKFAGDEPQSVRAKIVLASHLEAIGLPDIAHETILEAVALRPELLSLSLWEIYLSCRHGVDVDKAAVARRLLSSQRYDTGALFKLDQLVELEIKGGKTCFVGYPFDLTDVLWQSTRLRGFGYSPLLDAKHWNLMADHFLAAGSFAEAAAAMDKAVENTPTVDLLLKQALLLSAGGLIEPALDSIRRAIRLDESRGARFLPSRGAELALIERSLVNQKMRNGEGARQDDTQRDEDP